MELWNVTNSREKKATSGEENAGGRKSSLARCQDHDHFRENNNRERIAPCVINRHHLQNGDSIRTKDLVCWVDEQERKDEIGFGTTRKVPSMV